MNSKLRQTLFLVFLAFSFPALSAKASTEHAAAKTETALSEEDKNKEEAPSLPQKKDIRETHLRRASGTFGLNIGILHPTPGGIGLGAFYYVIPELRLGVSIGTAIFLTTMGIDAHYMFLKDSLISPFAGVQINRTEIVDIVGTLFKAPLQNATVNHMNFDVGVDLQTSAYFNMGFGLSFSAINAPVDNVLPYMYLGLCF